MWTFEGRLLDTVNYFLRYIYLVIRLINRQALNIYPYMLLIASKQDSLCFSFGSWIKVNVCRSRL